MLVAETFIEIIHPFALDVPYNGFLDINIVFVVLGKQSQLPSVHIIISWVISKLQLSKHSLRFLNQQSLNFLKVCEVSFAIKIRHKFLEFVISFYK